MTHTSPSRRKFLASTLAAVGAASLAKLGVSSLLAADAAPAKKLGFVFVGLGDFATNHLMPHVGNCKYCEPVAVVSGHPDKAKMIAAKFRIDSKNIYNYDNFDSIKDNPAIDVVYVVLPNGLHAEYVIRAFAAGKHVMCEKPMANTAADCRRMIDAGKAAGKKLQIGYRMHFDAPTLACIDSLRKGDIGAIQIIENATGFNIGDPTQWRLNRALAGGGCLMDIGIYSLNAARYLSGQEPTEVYADTYADPNDARFKEVEQHCDFQLRFPSGVLASCQSSYATGLNRFEIHGSKGQCVLEPGQGYNGARFQINKTGVRGGLQPVDIPINDQFADEMDGFAMYVAGAAPGRATGEEGLQDMRIIEAIYESARTGKSVKI